MLKKEINPKKIELTIRKGDEVSINGQPLKFSQDHIRHESLADKFRRGFKTAEVIVFCSAYALAHPRKTIQELGEIRDFPQSFGRGLIGD